MKEKRSVDDGHPKKCSNLIQLQHTKYCIKIYYKAKLQQDTIHKKGNEIGVGEIALI